MQKRTYKELHQNILDWYQQNGRVTLPWRNTDNPYPIYLSEIMLQQTQVKTVLERFYFPFLKKFPSLLEVASAPVDEILKAWEGLGYYTRARNLHKTAQETQGKLPKTAQELEKLSGIGKSTAHAVACFAFDEALPILDANVKRILYRFFAIEKRDDKVLWEKAYELFDKKNAYLYNQTLMDIGSMVCTHKNPDCISCPLESQCQGKEKALNYPEKKVVKKKPHKKHFMIIYHYQNTYHLSQNKTKFLGGLWGFKQVKAFKINPKITSNLGEFTHHYSHFRLDATVLLIQAQTKDLEFFSIAEIDKLALSGADRKALEMLKQQISICES